MTSIRVNLKRLREIRMHQHYFSSNDLLGHVESSLLLWTPVPFRRLGRQGSKRCENMGTSEPHVAIVVDKSNEAAELLSSLGSVNLHDGRNLVFQRLNAIASYPVP